MKRKTKENWIPFLSKMREMVDMTMKYIISRKELNKKKPKVRSKEVSGAHGEHRDAKQIISVLKKMKKDNVGKAC